MTSTEQRQLAQLNQATSAAQPIIANRLRDARSHAGDGRVDDASARLGELVGRLTDLVGNAREKFYLTSFTMQADELDPEIVDPNVRPTPLSVVAARTVPIAGRDSAKHLKSLVDQAEGELRLATSIQRPNASTKAAYLANWESRHRATLASALRGELSNAQISLYNAVGQLMIRPEVR